MDTLMKARLSDFKKKASDQTKKLKKESVEVDVLDTAVALVDKKVGDEQGFADIAVGDKTMKLDTYSAKRVTDVYGNLDAANQIKFRQMLNFSPETYLKAVDFAVKN
jgi:hypothetical protein